jgi:Ca-activated chloride channel family protein
MRRTLSSPALRIAAVLFLAAAAVTVRGEQSASTPSAQQPSQGPAFRSGVELVNVTATVSDRNGRFVSNLRREDFIVYEDDQLVEVTNFSAERVPVSLGIALDTSGSMAGTKMREAQAALDRFVHDLLAKEDELFLCLFSNFPAIVQDWTTDRRLIARALEDVRPNGGTAMYDAVLRSVTIAAQGQHQKKALVVISDGNDTASRTEMRTVKQQIRESEVLVYAIGIDGEESPVRRAQPPPRVPFPVPLPFPPGGRGRFPLKSTTPQLGGPGGWTWRSDDRVNVTALRDLTDDSGGRTEIIRDVRDLDPATTAIADELSKQYYLGYPSADKKDGRWHSIRVEVRNGPYRVRARKGYIAS